MIEIYSSAKFSKDNKEGKISFIIVKNGLKEHEITKKIKEENHIRTEMISVLRALEFLFFKEELEKNKKIIIYNNNSFLIDCFNKKYYKKWEKNGWMNKYGNPIKNTDIFEDIIFFDKNYTLQFISLKSSSSRIYKRRVKNLPKEKDLKQ